MVVIVLKMILKEKMHPVERYQAEMWRNFDTPKKRKKKVKKNENTILHGTRTLQSKIHSATNRVE
jgi:hypothetical protein